MDISLSEDQTLLQETAQSFAKAAMDPAQIRELESSEAGFDRTVWSEMAKMGWAAAPFPEKYGGSDVGSLELALIVEALGQNAIPTPIFSTVVESGLLLVDAGSESQMKHWLPRIAAGDVIMTTAITEPNGGLSPPDIKASIVPAGNGFRIDGTKLFVRDAGTASAIICLARSGEDAENLTLAIVPREAAGLRLGRLQAAGGETLWEVKFDGVVVDADAIVGDIGCAWPYVARLLCRGAALKSAELVGIGKASLDLTLDYAKERVQFGKPIGSFQAVQHHCANMSRDLEVSRLLAWQAAHALTNGADGEREVSMAKAKCSDAIPTLTRTAHQIHGAIGYYRDYPLELFYHRAIAAQAAYGDAAHHRRALARMMTTNLEMFRGQDRNELPVYSF